MAAENSTVQATGFSVETLWGIATGQDNAVDHVLLTDLGNALFPETDWAEASSTDLDGDIIPDGVRSVLPALTSYNTAEEATLALGETIEITASTAMTSAATLSLGEPHTVPVDLGMPVAQM